MSRQLHGGDNMLSLGRNPGQYVVINENIIVQVVSIDGVLRLAIDAPRNIRIERGENYEKENPIPACILHSQLLEKGKRRSKQ